MFFKDYFVAVRQYSNSSTSIIHRTHTTVQPKLYLAIPLYTIIYGHQLIDRTTKLYVVVLLTDKKNCETRKSVMF